MRSFRSRALAVTAAALLGVLVPGVAQAAPPDNDDFATSTVISSLPFVTEQNLAEATKAVDDPVGCGGDGYANSVWFSYTAPESGLLRLLTDGSDRDLMVTTYTGERNDLKQVWDPFYDGCTVERTKPVTFPATAGTTYHFMVSGKSSPVGTLKLAVDRIAPLANDRFADAQPVSLPFSAPNPDYTRASYEPDEPGACGAQGLPSIWYSYTAAQTQSLVAMIDSWGSAPELGVYEGTSLAGLTALGCVSRTDYSGEAFRLEVGKTYYFQWVGGGYYSSSSTLKLSEAAPLRTQLHTSTDDQPVYLAVGFSATHYNSYNAPVTTEWDFGDGTTAPPSTNTSQEHKYAKDGVYEVKVRSTSADGRTTTATTTTTVKTHDVGITKFTVPSAARAGEQKTISVQVANTNNPEKPTVRLYKSDGSSWTQVASQTIEVPAHPTRKVTFSFKYTFTAEDAAIGRVTFRAVAELPWPVEDARPMDNEVIAIATTVRPAAAAAVSN
ncbi:hypothetical protein GCM10022267_50660 [Lentzea roselyniae]|uniref:PKD domain-containing protein n=1 Tax=Lentzea roselyniae TaxID=531940 RepID=A0ABP7BEH9_9PSEU